MGKKGAFADYDSETRREGRRGKIHRLPGFKDNLPVGETAKGEKNEAPVTSMVGRS